MDVYFINTDAGSNGGISYHDEWLTRGVAVTSGEPKYRKAISKIPSGALVLPYVNGVGVVAVGETLDAKVVDLARPNTISPQEENEYHRRVAWVHDLRASPITWAELVATLGQGPLHAVQRVNNGIEALLERLKRIPIEPVTDHADYERLASLLLRHGSIERPKGEETPRYVEVKVKQYYRLPSVRAWTLQRANGCCELCNQPAPFLGDDGEPWLESHHVKHLAKAGRHAS